MAAGASITDGPLIKSRRRPEEELFASLVGRSGRDVALTIADDRIAGPGQHMCPPDNREGVMRQ
jgi:hypothetical protein